MLIAKENKKIKRSLILIFLRADASKFIGGGHINRCNQLAYFYSKLNCKTYLITKNNSLKYLPNDHKFSEVIYLSEDDEFFEIKSKYKSGCDLLIIDSYKITYKYQKLYSDWAKKILIINDYKNSKFYGDMRLNQNLQNRFIKIKNKIYLNGPQFSLINPTYFL